MSLWKDLFAIAVTMTVLDSVYLQSFKSYYTNQIESVQKSKVKFNMVGAVACYLFLVLGLYYFIIHAKKSVMDAFFLGIVIYSVFELTNYAIFSNWSFKSVMIDTTWGGILFALTTKIVYMIQKYV